ncbi:MAG: bifunctional riboflavin kinase/FAD synthetase [Gammaproteobacteria bacterium]|nr:MAG: bifunctional riboflavin kinase/FAD synthetase [Gammaproteobacteria bacterium]
MELIRGLYNLRARHRGCVATIGNFDGVHLGHQAVLGQLASMSAELDMPATVIIFEPQPQEFFARDKAPARLTRFREKIQALRRYSVQRVLCLRFDDRLAHTPPGEFIQRLLVEGLAVRRLVVGDDFRFGYRREGNFSLLQQAGEQYDFQVVAMHSYSVEGVRVSSTRVREALAQGDLEAAQKWLGRPYRMSGRVARGDRRGSALGFPTANIHMHRMVSPVAGVFAVEVYGLEREPLEGVANVGTRPTVDGTRCLLEVHVLDFDQDIYGRHVQVEFLHKLRDEQRFASLDELKNAIARDCEQAREFFRKTVASS